MKIRHNMASLKDTKLCHGWCTYKEIRVGRAWKNMEILTCYARCPTLPEDLWKSQTEVRNRVAQLDLYLGGIVLEEYGGWVEGQEKTGSKRSSNVTVQTD